jgi:hypothetical protein
MDLKEMVCDGVDFILLVHWWAAVNTIMNLWVTLRDGNFLTN